jgi:hypothetical protein
VDSRGSVYVAEDFLIRRIDTATGAVVTLYQLTDDIEVLDIEGDNLIAAGGRQVFAVSTLMNQQEVLLNAEEGWWDGQVNAPLRTGRVGNISGLLVTSARSARPMKRDGRGSACARPWRGRAPRARALVRW